MDLTRLPVRLALLPGLRWTGKLTVRERTIDGQYVIDWDAVDPRAHPAERHILDVAVLTAKQVKDWTGWEERDPIAAAVREADPRPPPKPGPRRNHSWGAIVGAVQCCSRCGLQRKRLNGRAWQLSRDGGNTWSTGVQMPSCRTP